MSDEGTMTPKHGHIWEITSIDSSEPSPGIGVVAMQLKHAGVEYCVVVSTDTPLMVSTILGALQAASGAFALYYNIPLAEIGLDKQMERVDPAFLMNPTGGKPS